MRYLPSSACTVIMEMPPSDLNLLLEAQWKNIHTPPHCGVHSVFDLFGIWIQSTFIVFDGFKTFW